MDGHLGCFQFFPIISNAMMNILGCASLPTHRVFLGGILPTSALFLGEISVGKIAYTKTIHILHFNDFFLLVYLFIF